MSALPVRALLTASVVALCPAPVTALQLEEVAGTIDGTPVTVGEVDQAAGGIARDAWRALATIEHNAARALCAERVHEMLAQSEGIDPQTWRARLWEASKPRPAQSDGPRRKEESGAQQRSMPDAAEHEARVRAYRQRLAALADRILARELAYAAPVASQGEPELPEIVASCLGRTLTRDEVQSYAAYPIYERRAELIAKLCEQFEIDYAKPLVVGRVAAAEGKTVEGLLAQIEGDLAELPEEDVRRAASERFGRVDDVTMLKARLTLDAQRREDRRRAWIEKVRRETQARCTLAMPPSPQGDVRAPGIATGPRDGFPVYYFGNLDCTNCRAGWQMQRAVSASQPEKVRVEFLHHFPEADLGLFTKALEAQCAAQQGRFEDYGEWRTSPLRLGTATDAVGLDAAQMESCMQSAATAVSVLDDTAEALRLGFREAVPSWVIGRRIKRGFLGQKDVDREIEEQLATFVPTQPVPPPVVAPATEGPAPVVPASDAPTPVAPLPRASAPYGADGTSTPQAAPPVGAGPSDAGGEDDEPMVLPDEHALEPPGARGAGREPGGSWR